MYEKNKFFARQFHTFYEKKFDNLRPLLSIPFPKGLQISKKKKWTLDFGKWGKKQMSEKMSEKIKKICKNLFRRRNFSPFMRKSFQIWDHFFQLLFPRGFWMSKKIGYWTFGSGGKKTFQQSEKVWRTDKQTNIRTFRPLTTALRL